MSNAKTTTNEIKNIANKQTCLVSGINIKTVNGTSLLGSGDIVIDNGTEYTSGNAICLTGDVIAVTTACDTKWSTDTIVDISSKQNTLVSGTNIKTVNGTSLLGSGDIVVSGGPTYTPGNAICLTGDAIAVTAACDNKWSTDTIVDISGKQNSLVSGTNIKTVNGISLLGSGDIVVTGDIKSHICFDTNNYVCASSNCVCVKSSCSIVNCASDFKTYSNCHTRCVNTCLYINAPVNFCIKQGMSNQSYYGSGGAAEYCETNSTTNTCLYKYIINDFQSKTMMYDVICNYYTGGTCAIKKNITCLANKNIFMDSYFGNTTCVLNKKYYGFDGEYPNTKYNISLIDIKDEITACVLCNFTSGLSATGIYLSGCNTVCNTTDLTCNLSSNNVILTNMSIARAYLHACGNTCSCIEIVSGGSSGNSIMILGTSASCYLNTLCLCSPNIRMSASCILDLGAVCSTNSCVTLKTTGSSEDIIVYNNTCNCFCVNSLLKVTQTCARVNTNLYISDCGFSFGCYHKKTYTAPLGGPVFYDSNEEMCLTSSVIGLVESVRRMYVRGNCCLMLSSSEGDVEVNGFISTSIKGKTNLTLQSGVYVSKVENVSDVVTYSNSVLNVSAYTSSDNNYKGCVCISSYNNYNHAKNTIYTCACTSIDFESNALISLKSPKINILNIPVKKASDALIGDTYKIGNLLAVNTTTCNIPDTTTITNGSLLVYCDSFCSFIPTLPTTANISCIASCGSSVTTSAYTINMETVSSGGATAIHRQNILGGAGSTAAKFCSTISSTANVAYKYDSVVGYTCTCYEIVLGPTAGPKVFNVCHLNTSSPIAENVAQIWDDNGVLRRGPGTPLDINQPRSSRNKYMCLLTSATIEFPVVFTNSDVDVYLNGLKLPNNEYTLGINTVCLNQAAAIGDIIDIIGWSL